MQITGNINTNNTNDIKKVLPLLDLFSPVNDAEVPHLLLLLVFLKNLNEFHRIPKKRNKCTLLNVNNLNM